VILRRALIQSIFIWVRIKTTLTTKYFADGTRCMAKTCAKMGTLSCRILGVGKEEEFAKCAEETLFADGLQKIKITPLGERTKTRRGMLGTSAQVTRREKSDQMGKSGAVVTKEAKVVLAYAPREHQYEVHRKIRRFNVVLCHRRWGKSVMAINLLIELAVKSKKPMPRFAYIAPTYSQAKRVSWSYFKEYTKDIPGVEYNEAEMRVDFAHNGARMLLSAENPMSLKGIYLDYVVLDEYGDMSPVIWGEVIRPTLSDRKGHALFIGTVKGQNHFWEMYEYARDSGDKEWYCASYKASETKIIPEEELESARKTMSEEQYAQEYENDPLAGLIGAYFAKELALAEKEKRITAVPHDQSLKVDTYWDLGINDTTAIWFVQNVRGRLQLIDYYEICGASAAEIVRDLKKLPYNYGNFIMPHDAKARDLSTGKSQMQIFYGLGLKNIKIIPRVGSKRDSINAARMIFSRCYFDRVKCAKGLKGLANYQRKFNSKNNVFEDAPLHNWASNCADSFQQLALGENRGSSDASENISSLGVVTRNGDLRAVTEYNPYGGH
jgi:phage terminase large subunit